MTAKGKKRRQLTANEKLTILEEARQPHTAVAEVLRRHQLDATTFYRWEREAKAGMLEALRDGRRRRSDDKDREIERLKQDLEKKSRVIAEVVEENGLSGSSVLDSLQPYLYNNTVQVPGCPGDAWRMDLDVQEGRWGQQAIATFVSTLLKFGMRWRTRRNR